MVKAQKGMAGHFPLYRGAAYGQNGMEYSLDRSLKHAETASLYNDNSKELGQTFAPPDSYTTRFPDAKLSEFEVRPHEGGHQQGKEGRTAEGVQEKQYGFPCGGKESCSGAGLERRRFGRIAV